MIPRSSHNCVTTFANGVHPLTKPKKPVNPTSVFNLPHTIVKALKEHGELDVNGIVKHVGTNRDRIHGVCERLAKAGAIHKDKRRAADGRWTNFYKVN